MDFHQGGGGPFRNGAMPPDYNNMNTHYINFEYQDIISRISKLELTVNQQSGSVEEVKTIVSGLESRMTNMINTSLENMQQRIIESIENKLERSTTSVQEASLQQDDQLSNAIFSTKDNSITQRRSITESHGKDSMYDPLDIPSFSFQSLAAENFPQMSKTQPSAHVQKGQINKKLNFSLLPVLKAITKRTNPELESRSSPSNSKVAPFQPFYELEKVLEGLRDGSLYQGMLVINKKNRQEASVVIETTSGPMKVLILGENARNRSLQGDLVAIKLNAQKMWERKQGGAKALVPYSSAPCNYALWSPDSSLVPQSKGQGGLFDSLDNEDTSTSFAAITSKFYPSEATRNNTKDAYAAGIPTGRVVAILNDDRSQGIKVRSITRRVGQALVGSLVPRYGFDNPKLTKNEPLPKSENTVEFRPLDNRFPFLMIQREELPKQFVQNPFSFKSPTEKLVVCSIRGWFEKFRFPLGRFVKIIGESYSIPAETEALIKETNCSRYMDPFSDQIVADLSKLSLNVDRKGRIDLTGETIFSISNDLQSIQVAFHCKPYAPEPDVFEIGVHVTDISKFVTENSAIDLEAFNRAVKVSLVNRQLPMLPSDLTHKACSLKPGLEREAVSIIFYLNQEGQLRKDIAPVFLKTIIRSCASLSLDVAEKLLEQSASGNEFPSLGSPNRSRTKSRELDSFIVDTVPKQKVIESVRSLLSLGKKRMTLRRTMQESDSTSVCVGKCLSLPNKRNSFRLDANGEPTNIYSIQNSPVEETVLEFETIANFVVAEKLVSKGSQLAFLLKQSPPEIDEQNYFWQVLCLYGLPDPRSSQLSPEVFVKVFQNVLSKTLPKPSSSSDPVFSKIMGKIFNNFAQMNAGTSNAFLSFLLRSMLPAESFGLAESNSLAIHGKVDFTDCHWLQNLPYFTSLTRPFDSYADITVSRLLALCLSPRLSMKLKSTDFKEEMNEKLAVIAQQCNNRIAQGLEAERRSNMLFLCSLVRKRSNQKKHLETSAVVTEFGQKKVIIYLLEYNQLCKVNVFVDWHAVSATTSFHDGTYIQYKVDKEDKLVEPPRDLLEKSKEKASVSMIIKIGKDSEIELSYGTEVKILLKPQVERKRVLGFRTDLIQLAHGGKVTSRKKNSRH